MDKLAVVLLVLIGLLGTGCVSMQLPEPYIQEETKFTNVTLDEAWCKNRGFDIYVRMWEKTKYNYIIQEITLNNGDSIVECWELPHGRFYDSQRDHHWKTDAWPYHARQMIVYPGTVEDADLTSGGFAMLPENQDGSVKTTVGANFNAGYRWKGQLNHQTGEIEYDPKYGINHEIRGRITESGHAMGVTWNFVYERGKLMIFLPDGSVHIYYDPKYYRED